MPGMVWRGRSCAVSEAGFAAAFSLRKGSKHRHDASGRAMAAATPAIDAGKRAKGKNSTELASPMSASVLRRGRRSSSKSVFHHNIRHAATKNATKASPTMSVVADSPPTMPIFTSVARQAPVAHNAKRYPCAIFSIRGMANAHPAMARASPMSFDMVSGRWQANAKSKSGKNARLAIDRNKNATRQLGPATKQISLVCSPCPLTVPNYSAASSLFAKNAGRGHPPIGRISPSPRISATGGMTLLPAARRNVLGEGAHGPMAWQGPKQSPGARKIYVKGIR